VSREDFLMFVPGPVEIPAAIRAAGSRRLPYMRTAAFSRLHLDVVAGLNRIIRHEGETALLTASGTGAMEAAVASLFRQGERVVVVNGGGFGERWVQIAKVHGLEVREIRLEPGRGLDPALLKEALAPGAAGVLLNAHETTTGQLFDVRGIGALVRDTAALFVVDAISSICCDEYAMDDWGVDATVFSSQKGLALPPGMSFVALSGRGAAACRQGPRRSYYFHLADYLENGRRGQAPFTIAVGIMLQLEARLAEIADLGVEGLVAEHRQRACHFRSLVRDLPVSLLAENPSNALSALRLSRPPDDAFAVVQRLEREHRLYVAPNPEPLRSRVFRVGHMGAQSLADLDTLAAALRQVLLAGSAAGCPRGEQALSGTGVES
jgi:aspartate aminotransferase-like enzyme